MSSDLKFGRRRLIRQGAIGDTCFRYFDAKGEPFKSALMQRVLGIELLPLKRVPRVVGVSVGRRKVDAILASLRGRRYRPLCIGPWPRGI